MSKFGFMLAFLLLNLSVFSVGQTLASVPDPESVHYKDLDKIRVTPHVKKRRPR